MADSEIAQDGDAGWIGVNSRAEASLVLPKGMLSLAENLRLDRLVARARGGGQRVADDVNASSTPLTIPFDLGVDVPILGITRSGGTATVETDGPHLYEDGAKLEIRGANQPDYNGDYVITVVDADTFTYTVLNTPATPATGTMFANDGPEVLTSYGGGILAAGIFKSPHVSAGKEYIVLVGPDAAYLWRQGEGLITKGFPTSPPELVEPEDDVTVLQAFDRLYILRGRAPDGEYIQKAVTSITRAGTTATVTMTGAHGWETGQRIAIEGAAQAGYGQEFDITVTGSATFTMTVDGTTVTPATGTITARRVKPPIYWDGGAGAFVRAVGGAHPAGPTYRRMPGGTAVAAYINSQMVVAPTPVRDSILVANVLDPDTYDPMLRNFRANAGSADYLVAVHPFAQGEYLLFMRRSIYRAKIVLDYATGTTVDTGSSFIQLVTDEVGCSARKTICTAGAAVFFLSDSGVYRLDTSFTDLQVRGNTLPLSEPIQDQIDQINGQAVAKCSAVYHDNRYQLAVPLGEAEEPNAKFVYNTLNQQWESADTYRTEIHTLLVGDWDGRRRLFAAGRSGKLFLLDERDDGDEQNSGTGIDVVPGRMRTRRYSWGTPNPKRMLRVLVNAVLPAGAALEVYAVTYDPDARLLIGTLANAGAAEEDYAGKFSVRSRCHQAEVEIVFTAGRPLVRSVVAEAVLPGMPPGSSTRSEN